MELSHYGVGKRSLERIPTMSAYTSLLRVDADRQRPGRLPPRTEWLPPGQRDRPWSIYHPFGDRQVTERLPHSLGYEASIVDSGFRECGQHIQVDALPGGCSFIDSARDSRRKVSETLDLQLGGNQKSCQPDGIKPLKACPPYRPVVKVEPVHIDSRPHAGSV